MTKIIEARQKLDKTLASHGLSDIVSLRKIVLKQLEKSSPGSISCPFRNVLWTPVFSLEQSMYLLAIG
jgi:hypothetical protein